MNPPANTAADDNAADADANVASNARADASFSLRREPRNVLFFDGVCGLCNRVVDFLVAHDHARRLRYAPLQGETFQAVAKEVPWLRAVDSVIAMRERADDGRREFFVHSRAVIFSFGQLGGWWRLVGLLAYVPRPLSDALYKFVARIRYAVFGKYERCRIPSPAERDLFLP